MFNLESNRELGCVVNSVRRSDRRYDDCHKRLAESSVHNAWTSKQHFYNIQLLTLYYSGLLHKSIDFFQSIYQYF